MTEPVYAAVLTALLMVAVPVALFAAGGVFMMRATGRARFRQRRREPASRPLNFRIRGYNATAAADYWRWLGAEGLAAEIRFLRADMLFPLWYGATMLGALAAGWQALGRPFPGGLLFALVAITVLADWVENVVHLRQIRVFQAGRPPHAGWIRIASVATALKLAFFWLSTLAILMLAGWVLAAGLAAPAV
jgi:hypothetical protein